MFPWYYGFLAKLHYTVFIDENYISLSSIWDASGDYLSCYSFELLIITQFTNITHEFKVVHFNKKIIMVQNSTQNQSQNWYKFDLQ